MGEEMKIKFDSSARYDEDEPATVFNAKLEDAGDHYVCRIPKGTGNLIACEVESDGKRRIGFAAVGCDFSHSEKEKS